MKDWIIEDSKDERDSEKIWHEEETNKDEKEKHFKVYDWCRIIKDWVDAVRKMGKLKENIKW